MIGRGQETDPLEGVRIALWTTGGTEVLGDVTQAVRRRSVQLTFKETGWPGGTG